MKENDFLSWIANQSRPHPDIALHIGDDMAAVRTPAGHPLALLKIDQCLDQVHFDLRSHTPAQAGRKAVNRCLSDCAAMACLPAAILLSLALPKDATEAFTRELFLACQGAAGEFDCPLVGGDTGIWDQRLAITVAALGWSAGPVVSRAGAQPGDVICVTGALGGSIMGRHLTFAPRIREALQLTAVAPIHAMMDLSDGLAMDLPRLCASSGVGAVIESRLVPIHPDVARLTTAQSPVQHALSDGEDYELLFTLPEDAWEGMRGQWPTTATRLTSIGRITKEKTLIMDGYPLPAGGWEHV